MAGTPLRPGPRVEGRRQKNKRTFHAELFLLLCNATGTKDYEYVGVKCKCTRG